MPAVVSEVVRMVDDPNANAEDIARVIETDPALAARILRISNSSYYGMRQAVGTIDLALVVLGLREVRNVVVGVSLLEAMKPPRESDMHVEWWIRHAFQVAGAAKSLCVQLRASGEGEAFIAGLLHDCGKIAFSRILGMEYIAVYRETPGFGEELCIAEREAFGFTHNQLGASLIKSWGLPNTLYNCVLNHHGDATKMGRGSLSQLAAIVRLANEASRSTDEEDLSWPILPEWDFIETPAPPAEVERRLAMLAKAQEACEEESIPFFE